MRRLKKRTGNRLAKVRYYDKNAQNASSEEEAEVITEESEEVVETEEVAEETEPADEAETAEAAETSEEVAEEEPEVVEEVEVAGTDEPEVIEEVGKITQPEETTEEEEETNAIEEVAEAVEPEEETETVTEVEDVEEVPLEYAEEESDVILEEEGSLDGSLDEVAALAEKAEEEEALKPEEIEPEAIEEVEVAGTDEPEAIEEVGKITEPTPTTEEEEEANAIEEIAEAVEPETENTETTEEVEAVEEVTEEPTEAEKAEELAVTATEELAEEETEEVEEVEESEEAEEAAEEEEEKAEADAEEKPAEKETFKLTAPSNLAEILSRICVKRGRKLIYRPNEILFNETATVLGTDKNNEEGIKVKNILDEEIKQGVKLGYIDKYDGLKMSEIKEEYENDTVYEYAEQEFKRTGLLLDGDKVKVYIYDWDMKALHHVGYIEGEEAEAVKPYLTGREKYSFDICGLITGGKYRKIIKDESGKVTVEKGNDGKLGVELDISVIARKD